MADLEVFSRAELATTSGLSYGNLTVMIDRKQAPTFIDSPQRTACVAFDALVLTLEEQFCIGSTGGDRSGVARALHHFLVDLYRLAARIDRDEPDLWVLMGLTNDNTLRLSAGPLNKVVKDMKDITVKTGSQPVRMTQVSANFAAIAVRNRAKQAGIKLGRFALTEKEVAEIAKLPFRRKRTPLIETLA